jgi:hypothetical protein
MGEGAMMQPEKQMLAPEGTEPVLIFLPKLPAGWKYSGAHHKPLDGECYAVNGQVHHSRGREALPYPIVVRAE